jgi:predicted RNase H-like HicB family nuclease
MDYERQEADDEQLPVHSVNVLISLSAFACKKIGVVSKYAVVIHQEPGGGYWAEVPALPGCYAQGESISELIDNVREAIVGVLEVMKEQGRQPESNIQILDVAI